jgi:hypothetical protein
MAHNFTAQRGTRHERGLLVFLEYDRTLLRWDYDLLTIGDSDVWCEHSVLLMEVQWILLQPL